MTATVGLVASLTESVLISNSAVCALIMDSTTSLLEAVLAAISIPQKRSNRSARATFTGTDGFQPLDREHGDVLTKAERGEYSGQTISGGGVAVDETRASI